MKADSGFVLMADPLSQESPAGTENVLPTAIVGRILSGACNWIGANEAQPFTPPDSRQPSAGRSIRSATTTLSRASSLPIGSK